MRHHHPLQFQRSSKWGTIRLPAGCTRRGEVSAGALSVLQVVEQGGTTEHNYTGCRDEAPEEAWEDARWWKSVISIPDANPHNYSLQ